MGPAESSLRPDPRNIFLSIRWMDRENDAVWGTFCAFLSVCLSVDWSRKTLEQQFPETKTYKE